MLFFKVKKSKAKLKHYSGKVTIDAVVLEEVRDELQAKLKAHAQSYIAALPPFA